MNVTPKVCLYCQATIVRRSHETASNFRERRYCNRCCMAQHFHEIKLRQNASSYMPSQAEIRERCRQIRAGWSATTEQNRRAISEQDWDVPVMMPVMVESSPVDD